MPTLRRWPKGWAWEGTGFRLRCLNWGAEKGVEVSHRGSLAQGVATDCGVRTGAQTV